MTPSKQTVEGLVMNRRFQKWVKYPSDKLDAFWHDWMNEDPERQLLVAEAREMILSLQFADHLEEAEISREWDKLQPLLQEEAGKTPALTLPGSDTGAWYGRMAAAIIFLLLSAGLLYRLLDQPVVLQYATQHGQIKHITLPDGSQVVLNANSSVSFAKAWEADKPREIKLAGEAYFSVLRQKNRQKFIVRTQDPYWVEVLGTTFTVFNRAERTHIFLNSGKVRLQKSTQDTLTAMLLQPGEVAVRQGEKFIRRQADPNFYLAFKDRKFIFRNTPVRDIATMLQDTYGIALQVADKRLLEKEFTGTFPSDRIDLVLQALSRTYNLEIRKKGQQGYLLSKKPANKIAI
jgi:transmembrane sensor